MNPERYSPHDAPQPSEEQKDQETRLRQTIQQLAREKIAELEIKDHRVGVNDPQYQQLRHDKLSQREADHRVFGDDEVYCADNFGIEPEDDSFDPLVFSQAQLVTYLATNPDLVAEIKPDITATPDDPTRLLASVHKLLVSVNNMTSEEYLALLRRHKERVESDVEVKSAQAGEMMTGLIQRVETAIVDLDLPILPDQARERLSTVRIQFFDPLSQVGQKVRSLGFYDSSIDTIYLNTSSTEEELLTILNHEGFHALEGRTPQVRSIVRAKFLGPEDEHASIRTGLSVDPRYGTQRFRWLDEAVTEDLNISVNDSKSAVYGLERDILGLLQKKVSSQVIRKAYFEDFEDGEAKVPGTPAWGEMQNQLAEAFEPGILLTLDKIIDAEDRKAYGLKKAAAYLREHFEQS